MKEGDATKRAADRKKRANERAKSFFKESDVDGDGSITVSEFEQFLLSTEEDQDIIKAETLNNNEQAIRNPCARVCCWCFQALWGIIGTVFIWIIYFLSAAIAFPSSILFMLTWLLDVLCKPFEEKSKEYITLAQGYLEKGTKAIRESSETARALLKQFRGFKDMTKMFNEGGLGSAMGAVNSVISGGGDMDTGAASQAAGAAAGKATSASGGGAASVVSSNLGTPDSYKPTNNFAGGRRRLVVEWIGIAATQQLLATTSSFLLASQPPTPPIPTTLLTSHRNLFVGGGGTGGVDPELLIEQGIDVMEVLNMTLVDTAAQLKYYKHVAGTVSEVCYDLVSLNSAILLILYGAVAVFIAEMITFAYHIKGFAGWSYEIQVMVLEQRLVEWETLEEKRENNESTQLDQAKVLHKAAKKEKSVEF
jgi:hypothetical protein